MQNITDAGYAMLRAISANSARNATGDFSAELLESLLDAQTRDGFDRVAQELMLNFWELVEEGIVARAEFKDLLENIVAKCPDACEPLARAFDEMNPFRDLLPQLPKAEETPLSESEDPR